MLDSASCASFSQTSGKSSLQPKLPGKVEQFFSRAVDRAALARPAAQLVQLLGEVGGQGFGGLRLEERIVLPSDSPAEGDISLPVADAPLRPAPYTAVTESRVKVAEDDPLAAAQGRILQQPFFRISERQARAIRLAAKLPEGGMIGHFRQLAGIRQQSQLVLDQAGAFLRTHQQAD